MRNWHVAAATLFIAFGALAQQVDYKKLDNSIDSLHEAIADQEYLVNKAAKSWMWIRMRAGRLDDQGYRQLLDVLDTIHQIELQRIELRKQAETP